MRRSTLARTALPLRALALAVAVIASHTIGAAALGVEPLLDLTHGRESLGFLAVLCFFTLSGFLLAASRQRLDPMTFLWNRGLRIIPGYALALVIASLVALPVAAALQEEPYDWTAASSWLAPRLLFLPGPGDETINAAYGGASVNAPLWSLIPEIQCYIALAIVPRRWLRPTLLGAVVLLALWLGDPVLSGPAPALMLSFALGAAAWEWRVWVPISPVASIVAALVALYAMHLSWHPAGTALMAYAALGLVLIPVRLRTDVSYGTYVLAEPAQHALIAAGVLALGVPMLFIATVGLVLAAATCVLAGGRATGIGAAPIAAAPDPNAQRAIATGDRRLLRGHRAASGLRDPIDGGPVSGPSRPRR